MMPGWVSTDRAAALLNVKPQTLRKSYCVSGSYLGIVPIKLPNRLLAWPEANILALFTAQ